LSTKNNNFWEIKTPEIFVQHPRKHLLRLGSDPQKKIPSRSHNWTELLEWLFPFPSHNSLREHTAGQGRPTQTIIYVPLHVGK